MKLMMKLIGVCPQFLLQTFVVGPVDLVKGGSSRHTIHPRSYALADGFRNRGVLQLSPGDVSLFWGLCTELLP